MVISPILSQLASFSIPVPVTLVCACACAFMLAKIPKDLKERKERSADQPQPAADRRQSGGRRRSEKLIHKLTTEVENLHQDLSIQAERLHQLRLAIAAIGQGDNVEINDEAQQTLRSIEHHCQELPRTFEVIRDTTMSAVQALTQDADDR